MKRTAKHIVSTPKAIISGLAAIFFWGYGIFYLLRSLWAECVVFLALGLLFGYQFFKNASYIEIGLISVRRKFAGIKIKELLWTDIKEVGVIGEAVFGRIKNGKRKSGEKFIYFSPDAMNEKSRFQMIVNWPAKTILYVEYSPEALEQAQLIWNSPVKYYNAEDLYPDTKD